MNNRFPLYLPGKRQGLLVLPSPLTRKELEMLEEQITNALWVADATFVEDETPKVEPLAAEPAPQSAKEGEE